MCQWNFAKGDAALRVSVFLATEILGRSECTSCFQSCCSQNSFEVALGTLAAHIASEMDQKRGQVAPVGEQLRNVIFCHFRGLTIIDRTAGLDRDWPPRTESVENPGARHKLTLEPEFLAVEIELALLVYEARGKLQIQLLCGADDNPRDRMNTGD